jgi:hypothetical protein
MDLLRELNTRLLAEIAEVELRKKFTKRMLIFPNLERSCQG